jgi:hypothetical protein
MAANAGGQGRIFEFSAGGNAIKTGESGRYFRRARATMQVHGSIA